MITYNRICVKDFAVTDSEGSLAEVKRGKEYTTSAKHGDGSVTVFTNYWFRAPADCFAGEQRFT